MTRGYYVIEKGGKALKAVYLSGDAYLQDEGYGAGIVKEFSENREFELFEQLYAEMSEVDREMVNDIKPEWYRITNNSKESPFVDYSYVLTNNKLKVYHFGKILFTITKESATKWCHALQHYEELYAHFLYSPLCLRTLYEKEGKMWKILQNKFDAGEDLVAEDLKAAEFADLELEDYHTVDCWHRQDAPAYQKFLHIGGVRKEIKFVVSYRFHSWNVCIQLPYVRIGILNGYSFKTETAAMKMVRTFIRNHADELRCFAIVSEMYDEIAETFREGTEDYTNRLIEGENFEEHTKELIEYLSLHKWYTANGYFTEKNILTELYHLYDRKLKRPEE